MEKSSYDNTSSVDRNVAIQMITLGIIIIVVIITLISFIHIYSSKKEQILEDLHTESTQLETVITDHLNYSRHFINLIGNHIQSNYRTLIISIILLKIILNLNILTCSLDGENIAG